MYCEVDYDLRRYEAQQDALEAKAEALEAAEAEAEAEKEDEFISVVAKCNPNAKLDSKMFPQVKDVFFDLCDNDRFMEACFRALMEQDRRGDIGARESMDFLQKYYMERA